MTKYINVNGFSGVGKSTILNHLAIRHRTVWIPRVTTRPRRKHERLKTEYEFVSEEEYDRRINSASSLYNPAEYVEYIEYETGNRPAVIHETGNDVLLSTTHKVEVRKQGYRTGIPNPRFWPSPSSYIDLVISTFGYKSPEIKKYWENYCAQRGYTSHLQMINVFISMHDTEKMRKRLYDRCRKEYIDFGSKWRKNEEHFNDPFEEQYDHVVYNDGTIEQCVVKLEVIAGLRSAE